MMYHRGQEFKKKHQIFKRKYSINSQFYLLGYDVNISIVAQQVTFIATDIML